MLARLDARSGGAAAACLSLCTELACRGHEISIYTTMEGPGEEWREKTQAYGISVRRFGVLRAAYGVSLGLFRELGRALRKADVVHIHGIYRFHFLAAAFWCRRYRVPYIVKTMGMLDPFLFRVRRWRKWPAEKLLISPALARASAVQFTAEEEMLLAVQSGLFRPNNGRAVSNGIIVPEAVELEECTDSASGVEEFRRRFPETIGKKLILFLSRIDFKKGLDILAQAFGIVFRTCPNTHLVIVGHDEGYEQQARRYLSQEGVSEHVTFTGMLLGTAKAGAYRSASVFVLPSYTENFGMVVCEAMSHAIPIVISNRVNIWREIERARAGIVTDCDPIETAAAILKVIADPKFAKMMAERGRRLVTERFSAPVVAEEMLSAYRTVLSNR